MEFKDPLILFDGVCNFCCASVQFVIKRDKNNVFHFCQLQSETGKQLMDKFGLSDSGLTSMVLIQNQRAYIKSSAALRIAAKLGGLWPLLSIFLIIPAVIRDVVYDFIGNHRYQWFGKKDVCWIPDDAIRQRFLDP